MRATARQLAAVAFVIPAAGALAADPCSLLTAAEIASIIEQPAVKGMPSGPRVDEDSGGQLSYCYFRTAGDSVVVSIVDFPSSAEAAKQFTKNLVQSRLDEEAEIKEQPGLGEKAYVGLSPQGVMYVFLKKAQVIGIGVGGETTEPDTKVAPLLAATQAVAGRL